jgi:hypothetical protein
MLHSGSLHEVGAPPAGASGRGGWDAGEGGVDGAAGAASGTGEGLVAGGVFATVEDPGAAPDSVRERSGAGGTAGGASTPGASGSMSAAALAAGLVLGGALLVAAGAPGPPVG